MFVVALVASLASAEPPVVPDEVPVAEQPAPSTTPSSPDDAIVEPPGAPEFAFDETVTVSNPTNDAFAMGAQAELDGPVGDNAFIMGGEALIEHPIHGDLFVMGGAVTIDAAIDGDVYAMGGEVELTSGASVGGHLSVGGGEVDLNGTVAGNANVGAGRLVLGGTVGGDAHVEAGELVFSDTASVVGDLNYTSPAAAAGADEVVAGSVNWTQGESEDWEQSEPSVLGGIAMWGVLAAWSYTSKLIVGVVLFLLFGAASVSPLLREKPAQSLGYGVAGFVLLPLLSILAMVFVLPIPLGLLGLATFGLALYICQLFAAQAVGELILGKLRPERTGAPALALAIGLVPLVFFSSLPWVGFLVWYVATVMGAGAMWMRLRQKTAE